MTRKLILLIGGTLSVSLAGQVDAAPPVLGMSATAATQATSAGCKTTKGLYERLGGIFGIAKVVDLFSDAIIVNPALNQNRALIDWNDDRKDERLPGLKVMRTIWIASMVGGPFKFTGLPLEEAHKDLNLTEAEFNAVGGEIVKALQAVGAQQSDIDQLVCLYNTSMDDVVVGASTPKEIKPPR